MAISADFTAYLEDQLAAFGPIEVKRMFGGAGVFKDGLMFALVANDTLYFKVDDSNRAAFESQGMAPFSYDKSGKVFRLAYYEVPSNVLEDTDAMTAWARDAVSVALEADAKKPPKKRRAKAKT